MDLTRVALVEQLDESVIGVRSRENGRCEQACSEYKQLCDVCCIKKAGGVILEGNKGSKGHTHVNI